MNYLRINCSDFEATSAVPLGQPHCCSSCHDDEDLGYDNLDDVAFGFPDTITHVCCRYLDAKHDDEHLARACEYARKNIKETV